MTTHPGVAQNRKKEQRSSIFLERKQCLSNSPEISGITFNLLFYFIIMFLNVFLTGAYPDSILLTFTIITEVLAWIMFWLFQCGMCDQQSHRSACAYAQCDQSLCLSLENFHPAVAFLCLNQCRVRETRMVFSYLTFLWNSNRPSSAFAVVTFLVRPLFSCKLKKHMLWLRNKKVMLLLQSYTILTEGLLCSKQY